MRMPETPRLTVDIVIRLWEQPTMVVLVERRYPPWGWALPGGFVDVGERVEEAARREAFEETGLSVRLEALLGCYSDPQRDARGHTVSVVYVAGASGPFKAGDDARACRLAAPDDLTVSLAFDHRQILEDYRFFLAHGAPAPLRA